MCKSPVDRHLHRMENVVPAGAIRLGCLFPTQSLGPASQIPGVALCQQMLTDRSRNLFHMDTVRRAIDSPRVIHEKHTNPPKRNKLVTSSRLSVVPRRRFTAHPAKTAGVAARYYLDFQCRFTGIVNPFDRLINKSLELLHTIKDSLELHPGSRSLVDCCSHFNHVKDWCRVHLHNLCWQAVQQIVCL